MSLNNKFISYYDKPKTNGFINDFQATYQKFYSDSWPYDNSSLNNKPTGKVTISEKK